MSNNVAARWGGGPLYWNIHGISSKTLGDKTNDAKFRETLSEFDVIGISELHTNNYISIPGFHRISQKFRVKKDNSPKIGGGIAVFSKNDIASNFRLLSNNNVDSIWITSTGSEETHIGFYYFSPENGDSNFQNIIGPPKGKVL